MSKVSANSHPNFICPKTPESAKNAQISNSPVNLQGYQSPNLFESNSDQNSNENEPTNTSFTKALGAYHPKQMPDAGTLPFTLLDTSSNCNPKEINNNNINNQLKAN